ncbi:MAG: ABC transporter ATP-binding protein [Proteobacteria bacterium]|nr:ABC transporter ATP-binding protein [Pseudomonadota bacterium]
MTAPILSLRAVTKRFGRTPVLDDVDLDIAPGAFTILIGGSGSGKTTLLRIVAGLDHAEAGSIELRGEVVDDPRSGRFVLPDQRRLGMVFQDNALWPHMTCIENVAAALRGRDRWRRARELLGDLGIAALAERRPAQLSGGQQQRVGLARALAAAPDMLLLDEPLSSLDVDARDRMRDHIRSTVRRHGAAALLVSHDPVDAWRLADRVAVLEQGRIVQAAAPEELYRLPATPRVARFTDALGGFPVSGCRHRGTSGWFDWGGDVQQAIVPGALAAGAPVRAFIRPCGVRAGDFGEPATLIDRTFENGAWRATWHVPARDWTLCSLEPVPPPAATRLALTEPHIFLYPEKGWSR